MPSETSARLLLSLLGSVPQWEGGEGEGDGKAQAEVQAGVTTYGVAAIGTCKYADKAAPERGGQGTWYFDTVPVFVSLLL